jgi:3-oxoacyl-[acyl-carrier protein] reductase
VTAPAAAPSRPLEGRVAIVTGASRGIGRAVALRLAGAGARLVLAHRRDVPAMEEVSTACRSLGAEVETHRGDLGGPSTAAALVELASTRFGRLDVLVNSAALDVEGLLADLDEAALQEMVSTNILGIVRTSRAALRPMLRQRSGSIVSLSSIAAARPGRGNAVYAGTKGFVEAFTRALAVEVGRKGIRVNAVAPGVVETGMTEALRALAGEGIKERVALRRFATPEEVAGAVAFLASDEASYISGAILAVDGGLF